MAAVEPMRYLGIDIGSSYIKGAVLDLAAMSLQHTERVRFPSPIGGLHPAFREFDPQEIVAATHALIERLFQHAPDAGGILMCSQLHGLVLSDENGSAVSNYINWQDQRALLPHPGTDGCYFDEINRFITGDERRQLGNEPLPGVTLSFLFWLARNGALPPQPTIAASLPYFIIGNLCAEAPKSDVTHAYGHGALNIETLNWHYPVIEKLGLGGVRWPEIVAQGAIVGECRVGSQTLPFFGPVGDYHCSQVGVLLGQDELSVNISTGSAVIRLTDDCEMGDFQTRPWFDGRYLKTITHLPAGRALNALVRLMSELGESQGVKIHNPWDYIQTEVERLIITDLKVDPAFYFSSMGERGSITNLREENMTVGHVFRAAIAGMADNYTLCASRISPKHDWRRIVFSGGVAAKTPLLRHLICERLVLMLSAQDSTGGAQPEVRPWSHRPGHMPPTPATHYRSDDCLWFFNAVPAYVAESGDTAFYQSIIPFADKGEATVLAHLRRAIEFNLERSGANGLPCGLLADWNDCLKLGYKGESVFVAFQLRLALRTYREISESLDLPAEQAWADAGLAALDKKIAAVCWDGEWFIWAITEDGTIFGTKNYPEGQVYLNTQAWAILSGAATKDQAERALATVRERLASEWGVAMCAPPFEKTPVKVMRAVLFNPGNKENAGIFSHTQSWAVLAEVLAGDGDTAWQYYRSFLPSAQNDRAEIREIEPYVHCQSTHSQFSEKFGRSRVPWLSGTASWAHFTATNYLLGIRPEPGGLRIDPVIPKDWPGFTATRRFRGATVHIEITNPNRKNRGVTKLAVNGTPLEGNFVPAPLLTDGTTIQAIL